MCEKAHWMKRYNTGSSLNVVSVREEQLPPKKGNVNSMCVGTSAGAVSVPDSAERGVGVATRPVSMFP